MINKEAIELLEKVNGNLWDYTLPNVVITNKHIADSRKLIDEALVLLKEQPEPKCKICGDKKPENYTQWLIELREEDKFLGHGVIKRTTNQKQELYKMYLESFHPCPACKEQPPASNFTKRFRVLLANQDKTVIVQDAYEACDRLDVSEASRKELLVACEEIAQKSVDGSCVQKIAEAVINANKKGEDKIGDVCDDCGNDIDTSSEGIITGSGKLLCMKCQSK